MVTKRRMLEETVEPPPHMDESWWESVLAEDEAKSVARPARTSRYSSSPEHLQTDHEDLSDLSMLDWHKATELYDQDQVVDLVVCGCNRGGLLVHGDGLQGFVPVSHLVETPCSDADLEKWLLRYIDQLLTLKVIECDQERGRVVFSERAAQSQPGSRKRLLNNLQPGHCVVGMVTNVTDFGVFVDLGGVEGLIHVSEISWGRVHHPNDVLKLGQQVEVFVIQVDQDRARVALSLKRMHPNPWETAEERYLPGQITEATVTSIVPFGAFARLEEGLDGLIHVSEFSSAGNPVDITSVLHEGQTVDVRILHVDASRQRLGLSLKLTGEY
jgi:small subunit ribosomal protein S1